MTKNQKTITNQARTLKSKMATKRTQVHATLKELSLLVQCSILEDYTQMKQTKLYNNHSGEYCEYLEMI